jgi:uncharacterized LabA/DUF88 family protein
LDNQIKTYTYIDASNLFYGGKKSLGWSIDYKKLIEYLKEKYKSSMVYFFGGVEVYKFPFDYLEHESVQIKDLEEYFVKLVEEKRPFSNEAELKLLEKHLGRIRFYLKIEEFGYNMVLKPIKTFFEGENLSTRKANCDVDMAFYMMRDHNSFDRIIVLSGDGDFLPVLKFLRNRKKKVLVLARGPRTAKEIRRFSAGEFLDFEYLRTRLEFEKNNL